MVLDLFNLTLGSISALRFEDSDNEVDQNDGFERSHRQVRRRRRVGQRKRKKRPSSKPSVEIHIVEFVEDSDDGDTLNIGEKRRRKSTNIDRKLSDEDCYNEEIETNDSNSSSDEHGERTKFASFVMPRKMDDFKWVFTFSFFFKR